MTAERVTVDDVVAAFGLPDPPARPTRIHKVDLIDAGKPTAADRKLIDAAIDRLDWIATLSPATTGVAAGATAPAIQLLTLTARLEPMARLLTLVHRAVPLPVVLVTAHGGGVRVSLAPLRPAERVEGVVVERLVVTPALEDRDAAASAFLASLSLGGLPRVDLAVLYEALVQRVEALVAATKAAAPFRLPATADEARARRAALAAYDAAAADYARARAAARAEKSLGRQVTLADAAALVKERLEAAAAALA